MTEWVTIKIPEDTRDKAKEDPRTYEEILKAGLGETVELRQPGSDEVVDTVENPGFEFPEVATKEDVEALRETIGDATTEIIEPVPSGETDYEEVLREVGKAVELAEQARDNTDEIKEKLK